MAGLGGWRGFGEFIVSSPVGGVTSPSNRRGRRRNAEWELGGVRISNLLKLSSRGSQTGGGSQTCGERAKLKE